MADTPHRSTLALRRISLLDGLSEACLDGLAQQCAWHNVMPHQALATRTEDRREVYFLVSGRVRVTTYSANGRQVTFRDCSAGEHFGDIAAIDGLPRSADVVALESGLVAGLAREHFLALLRDEPRVALRVMHGLASLVRQLSERVIDLSTLGVHHRLHIELLRLAQQAGVKDNRARLDPSPRHAVLAGQISTNREQITRELNALLREGLLSKDDRALVITDIARLAAKVSQARGEVDA